MRKFYYLIEKVATVSPNLSYSHYVELLPYENVNKIKYYIKITEDQNLSVRQLREIIKSNKYKRLDEVTRNKLIMKDKATVVDFVKNPIYIRNSSNSEKLTIEVGKKYNERNLRYMRQFYELFENQIWNIVCSKLS